MNSKAVLMRTLVILGIVSLVFLAGCGGGSYSNQLRVSNPTPTITTISPTSAAAGGAAFTLTLNGTNFVAASMVNFGGAAPATTFVSSTQLTASISAAAIASTGTLAVTVTNPAPGGGISNTMNFTITGGTNPAPRIDFLSPSGAAVGGPAFTLTVSGSNFVASSVVRWNGTDRPTAFVSSSQVTAQIPASDIAATGTATITIFNPAPGAGSSNAMTFTIASGLCPQSIAVDPTGKFVYVANSSCDAFVGNVSMYTLNLTTGALTSIGPPVTTADFGSRSVAVDPTGKFAYVANSGGDEPGATFNGSVTMYTINAMTGALTSSGRTEAPCAPPPSPGSCAPMSVAVHPSGKFAYVANEGGFAPTSVSMYIINGTTGTLAFIGTIATAGRAISVAMDPKGKFAYVATKSEPPGSAGVVSMYTIDASTGALTSIGSIGAGTDPVSVALDPTGKFAYVTNSGSNNVSMYSINATNGTLTSIGTVAAGTDPVSAAVNPTGKFAYVTNSGSNNVSMYSIDAAAGALTSVGTIASGSSPSSIAIDPSGKFAYVANSGSNNVSMYSIDAATGVLTLIGTIGT